MTTKKKTYHFDRLCIVYKQLPYKFYLFSQILFVPSEFFF